MSGNLCIRTVLPALPHDLFLTESGLLVMEHSKRAELPGTAGNLRKYRALTQGDSTLSFYRAEHD
jgi:16S rRNA G966 N2-methylase RsmD